MNHLRFSSSRRISSHSSAAISTASVLDETGTPIIPSVDLTLVDHENPLGKGSFGIVFRGIAYKEDVAIKMLFEKPDGFASPDDSARVLEALCEEVRMLAELHHTNVISFKGVCLDPPCIVTEYCPRGSVYDVLKKFREPGWDYSFSQSSSVPRPKKKMKFRKKLRIALGIAKGMYFLHRRNRPVLHCDLKSPNVVLREDWTAVVTDFGMARYKPARLETQINPTWQSPEMVDGEEPCQKSDVFSFAIVMWELLTGRQPWEGRRHEQIQCALLILKQRPDVPGELVTSEPARKYVQLMERCWSQKRKDRPNFDEIVESLEQIIHPSRPTGAACSQIPLVNFTGAMSPNGSFLHIPAAPAPPPFGRPTNGSVEVPSRKPGLILRLITCGMFGVGERKSNPPPTDQSQPMEQISGQQPQGTAPHLGHRPSPFARLPIKEEDESMVSQQPTGGGLAGTSRGGQVRASAANDLEESDDEEDEVLQPCVDTLFTTPGPRNGDVPTGARSSTSTSTRVAAGHRSFQFLRPEDASAERNTTYSRSGGGGSSSPLGVVGTSIPSAESLQEIQRYVSGAVAGDDNRSPVWDKIITLTQGWKLNDAKPVEDVEWRGFLIVFFGKNAGDKSEVESFRGSKHWAVLRRHLVQELVPVAGPEMDGNPEVDSNPEVDKDHLPPELSLESLGFEDENNVVGGSALLRNRELVFNLVRPSPQTHPLQASEHYVHHQPTQQVHAHSLGEQGYGIPHHDHHPVGQFPYAAPQPTTRPFVGGQPGVYPGSHVYHQPVQHQQQPFVYGSTSGQSQGGGAGNSQLYLGTYHHYSQGHDPNPPGDGVI